jgi:hypothetical protein
MLPILRKGWGSGKYFGLERVPQVQKFEDYWLGRYAELAPKLVTRDLMSKKAEEAAYHVLDIFTTFNVPIIL